MELEAVEPTKGAAETAPVKEQTGAEREPKINLKFFYASHEKRKPEDWKKLAELLPWADIYAVELMSHTEKERTLYESVSTGTANLEDVKRKVVPLIGKEFELLHGSQKPVIFIDVPWGHPALDKSGESAGFFRKALVDFISGRFDDAVVEADLSAGLKAEAVRARDEYIKLKIKSLISNLKDHLKKTKNKDVNVLVRIGSGHSLVSRDIAKEGMELEDVFSEEVTVMTYMAEIVRRINYGREVSGDLSIRALMEALLGNILFKLTDESEPLIYLSRRIISQLTFDDMRQISLALQQGKNLISEIEARGIKVPKDKEEASEMVKEIKRKWGRED